MIRKFSGIARLLPAVGLKIVRDGNIIVSSSDEPFSLMDRKGVVCFKIAPKDARLFKKWVSDTAGRNSPFKIEIELTFIIKGKPRSLDQNRLYWALINILSLEVYGEHGWEEYMHEEILEIYAPRVKSKLRGSLVPKRSKDMDVGEFVRLIEGVMYEINSNGVTMTEPADISRYWDEYARIRFSDDRDHGYRDGETLEEYRERVNYCEACRKYMRHGEAVYGGHIAHIVSRGAGGPDDTRNVLHLCTDDHLHVQHQKGWNEFLRKYPHLEKKVRRAHEKFTGFKDFDQKKLDIF